MAARQSIYVVTSAGGAMSPFRREALAAVEVAAREVEAARARLTEAVATARRRRVQDVQVADVIGCDVKTLRYRYGTRKGTSGRYENRSTRVVRIPVPRVES